jgi:NAD(P)-dependent dehydrogenase (short-subunit alcohol dehydrogenase family)
MSALKGKTSIVTGASRGIGRSIAMRLACDGANVVLGARDAVALAEVAADIRNNGGAAEAIALDLRTPESAGQFVDFAVAKFGRIDIVVNNAGATKLGDFPELTDADWADGFALRRSAGNACGLAAPEGSLRFGREYFRRGRPHARRHVFDRRIGERGDELPDEIAGGHRRAR